MTMAYLAAMKSKDPSTKIGAIIVGPNREIRSTGYNGLPRKINDLAERYSNKEYKYLAGNHAEENAILHCARIGVSTLGCSIYTPWIPCAQCAKAIIQVGITSVTYHAEFPGNERENYNNWSTSISISLELLKEAGIILHRFQGKLLKPKGLYNGKWFEICDETDT
ncbi:Uncharacterized deaminase in luxG 3'region [Alphaproteobacteria bacterium]